MDMIILIVIPCFVFFIVWFFWWGVPQCLMVSVGKYEVHQVTLYVLL